jgi:histone H3/H4
MSKAPIKRFMKEQGATLVSDGAIELLIEQLEIQAKRTTKKALSLVKDEKRKRKRLIILYGRLENSLLC